jgi:hypothetical protein
MGTTFFLEPQENKRAGTDWKPALSGLFMVWGVPLEHEWLVPKLHLEYPRLWKEENRGRGLGTFLSPLSFKNLKSKC